MGTTCSAENKPKQQATKPAISSFRSDDDDLRRGSRFTTLPGDDGRDTSRGERRNSLLNPLSTNVHADQTKVEEGSSDGKKGDDNRERPYASTTDMPTMKKVTVEGDSESTGIGGNDTNNITTSTVNRTNTTNTEFDAIVPAGNDKDDTMNTHMAAWIGLDDDLKDLDAIDKITTMEDAMAAAAAGGEENVEAHEHGRILKWLKKVELPQM